ncbi:MAG: hypothetical protein FWF38_03465 [Spirochaetaceae bacterium]|nr:hypothetical protein [Spirochaetaceae bacterium]
MKKNILVLLVICFLIFSFFTGCKEENTGLSIDDRIRAFLRDTSGQNRDSVCKDHFHSSSNWRGGNSGTLNTLGFTQLSPGAFYTAGLIENTGSNSRKVRVDETGAAPFSKNFIMREEKKNDWYIDDITN